VELHLGLPFATKRFASCRSCNCRSSTACQHYAFSQRCPGLEAQIYVLGNKIRSCLVLRLWLASKDVRLSDTGINTDGFDNELFAEITTERLMDGFEEDGALIQTNLYASFSKRGHMWCYRFLLFTSALAIIILLVVYDPPIAPEASYFHGSR
jgi:hypothetical protein